MKLLGLREVHHGVSCGESFDHGTTGAKMLNLQELQKISGYEDKKKDEDSFFCVIFFYCKSVSLAEQSVICQKKPSDFQSGKKADYPSKTKQ